MSLEPSLLSAVYVTDADVAIVESDDDMVISDMHNSHNVLWCFANLGGAQADSILPGNARHDLDGYLEHFASVALGRRNVTVRGFTLLDYRLG